jgi:hypothetical protein
MSTQDLTDSARKIWQEIMHAPALDRSRLFWKWARIVTYAQESKKLTLEEAASLLIWPESLDNLKGLADVADILIVLDTADAIVEGDAYLGVPEEEQRDWLELAERVDRHASSATIKPATPQ